MVIATGTIVAIAIAWALYAGSSMGPTGSITSTYDPDGWQDVYTAGTYDDPPISVIVQHNTWQIETDEYDATAATEDNPAGFVGRETEDKEAWRVITRNSSGTEMDLTGMNRFRDLNEAKEYADTTVAARQPAPSLPPEGPEGPQQPPEGGPVGPSGPNFPSGPVGGQVEIIETASTSYEAVGGPSFSRPQTKYVRD